MWGHGSGSLIESQQSLIFVVSSRYASHLWIVPCRIEVPLRWFILAPGISHACNGFRALRLSKARHKKKSAVVLCLMPKPHLPLLCRQLLLTSIFFPLLQIKSYPGLQRGITLTSLNTWLKTLSATCTPRYTVHSLFSLKGICPALRLVLVRYIFAFSGCAFRHSLARVLSHSLQMRLFSFRFDAYQFSSVSSVLHFLHSGILITSLFYPDFCQTVRACCIVLVLSSICPFVSTSLTSHFYFHTVSYVVS